MKIIQYKTLLITLISIIFIQLSKTSIKHKRQAQISLITSQILQKYSPASKQIYTDNSISKEIEKRQPQYVKHACAKYSTNVSLPYFIKYLKKYGFGACGPRGFLGSFTPHLLLERDIGSMYGQTGLVFSTAATVFESILSALHCKCLFLIDNDYPELNRALEAINTIQFKSIIDFLNQFDQNSKNELQLNMKQIFRDHQCQKVCTFTKKQWKQLNIQYQKKTLQLCENNGIRTCLYDDEFPLIDNQVDYSKFDVVCGSFEDSFGIPGGFAAACQCLIGTFRTNCPGYVYSASCPPALVASVRYMIRYVNKITE